MEKLKVGFDIDGCMNNFQIELQAILKNNYNVNLPPEVHNWNEYVVQIYKDINKFWEKYNGIIEDTMPAEKDASKILTALGGFCERNIITARGYRCAAVTESWLHKHELVYDNIYWECDTKLYACQYLGIEYMIEDSPINAQLMADNGMKVLLFERQYNNFLYHPNIDHCQSWDEVYEKLSYINYKNVIKC